MTARERILSACFGLVLPGIVAIGMPAALRQAPMRKPTKTPRPRPP